MKRAELRKKLLSCARYCEIRAAKLRNSTYGKSAIEAIRDLLEAEHCIAQAHVYKDVAEQLEEITEL